MFATLLLARAIALVHRARSGALITAHASIHTAYSELQIEASNMHSWLTECRVAAKADELARLDAELARISAAVDALDVWRLEHPLDP